MKLKVGVAGFGVVGKKRAAIIENHPSLELYAVSDIKTPEKTPNGVKTFSHFNELLKERLDLLFVCLPNHLASEVTKNGLERGFHVFCEKPPARNLNELKQVLQVEQKYPFLKLKYGFNHRYHLSVREALKIMSKGTLGELINMRGVYGKSNIINFENDWRTDRTIAGGGILLDQGIHLVDLMRLFAGEFEEVKSFISNTYWKHEVEDNAFALMRTKKGVIAFLHSSATQWKHRFQLEMAFQHGMLTLNGILSGSKSYGAETLTVAYTHGKNSMNPNEETTHYEEDVSWKEEIDDFVDIILNQKRIESGSSQDALKTMELVYRIYCADEKWKETYSLTDSIESKNQQNLPLAA